MDLELTRKLPPVVLDACPLPARREAGLVATERVIAVEDPKRGWRPDLWPAYVWVPLLCAPGVILVYVLAHLATFIASVL
jgi:hypothetical protein